MTRTPIIIGGQKIGRLRASKLLFMETFRFFWSDKEMLWVPLLALIVQLALIGLVVVAFFIPTGLFIDETDPTQLSTLEYVGIFLTYVVCAFTVAFSQATITHIVYTRIHGGDATLGDGLKVASSHFGSLFVWACITSTVGVVLRAIADRSELLVKFLVMILGAAWSVLTYFVVPAIVIDKKMPLEAVRHSSGVFKRTWGETLVTNISLGLIVMAFFAVFVLALFGLVFVTQGSAGAVIFAVGAFVIVLSGMVLLSSVLDSVLRTLLYVYATEDTVPANFNKELLEAMLVRKNPVVPSV